MGSSGSVAAPDLWNVVVTAVSRPAANTNWSTFSQQGGDFFACRNASSSAQNDTVSYDVALSAGTYDFVLLHTQGTSRGIYTVTIGGSALTALGGSADTIDGYAGSTAPARSTVTGVVIPAAGKYRVALTMATKNASSSSYLGSLSGFILSRTA